jgi:acetylornithine deacetylase/succinyl-diaminopimelate desuccinylase-like protein
MHRSAFPAQAASHLGRAFGVRLTWLAAVCLAVAALVMPRAACAALPAPDFAAAHKELIEILSGFIRVDTSNPPGNETRGAEYLKRLLDREGVASDILALELDRGNLVARVKGSGRKKPLLLMGHLDVVGVERDKWTVDPFGGVVKEGYIYGRGAADDKGMTSVCLEVLLLLHRLKIPLERDVIFLAEAGEESSTYVGIDYMVSKHWDKIECEFALNEGGRIYTKDGTVQYVGVATTEKVPRAIFLTAKGTSGHGSRPRADNAIVHLAAAVAKIGQWQPPMRLNETTRTFFERLAKISPPDEAFLFTHLEDPVVGAMVQERLRHAHPGYNSMLRTSVSPNVIKGGFRINVIPSDASASLDVRFLPEEDQERFAEALRKLIDDPAVEVSLATPGSRKPTPPSRLDTEMFRALERIQAKLFPDAATLPMMLTGATDSAQLRAKGVQAYGLGSVSSDGDSTRVHGNDERLSVAGLAKFLEYVWWSVLEIAAAKE